MEKNCVVGKAMYSAATSEDKRQWQCDAVEVLCWNESYPPFCPFPLFVLVYICLSWTKWV